MAGSVPLMRVTLRLVRGWRNGNLIFTCFPAKYDPKMGFKDSLPILSRRFLLFTDKAARAWVTGKLPMSETKKNSPQPEKNSGALIYVVDDEPMLLELATVILEPNGYHIKSFRDPEVALQTFTAAKPRPDLLITDYAMHTMNGMELIEQFRRLEPKLKILLVSGTVGEDIFQSSPSKPDYFLPKPYQAYQLCDVVKDLLSKQ
jgi:CheY-like chemotaxis protein